MNKNYLAPTTLLSRIITLEDRVKYLNEKIDRIIKTIWDQHVAEQLKKNTDLSHMQPFHKTP